jgi:hypothetical protein
VTGTTTRPHIEKMTGALRDTGNRRPAAGLFMLPAARSARELMSGTE